MACAPMQAVAETMMARDGKSPQLRLLVPTPLRVHHRQGRRHHPQLRRGLPGRHHRLAAGMSSLKGSAHVLLMPILPEGFDLLRG